MKAKKLTDCYCTHVNKMLGKESNQGVRINIAPGWHHCFAVEPVIWSPTLAWRR